MRTYCLKTEEIYQILNWRDCEESLECEELSLEIAQACCWNSKIICIALFFARLLEREQTTIDAKKSIIEKIYTMDDVLYFEIQEGDHQFVEYLLKHIRNPNESLEATLIELQNGLSEYNYEKALRY